MADFHRTPGYSYKRKHPFGFPRYGLYSPDTPGGHYNPQWRKNQNAVITVTQSALDSVYSPSDPEDIGSDLK